MQLHYNLASPFARKVLVLAREVGLADRLELVVRMVNPVAPVAEVVADNPLGKIPCLVTDDGLALYDSRVIAEYLDGLHDGPRMFPAAGPARWAALRHQAIGDGMMEAAVLARYETLIRPEAKQWDDWTAHQKLKVARAVDALEAEAATLGAGADIGTITIGCALGYLDFRYASDAWRSGHAGLAAWYETFGARPAMLATAPQ
jgi:glutathione S-transferase